ncbi:MAG: hypothetical protein WA821_12640 [Anaerolineales bacterium]
MANRIKAINAYMPSIVLGKRIVMSDIVAYIAHSTGLNEGIIRQVLAELRDTVIFFLLHGQSVQLEGLGTYTPTIDLTGEIGIGHRADVNIKYRLNDTGAFKADIENREYIGKSGDDLVAKWNTDHPDDKVA